MKSLLFFALLLFASSAIANPFAQASVATGVASCNFSLDGGAKVNVTATAGLCKLDMASTTVGSHSLTVTAVATNDPIWGSQETAPSAPLAFVRPASPAVPTGLQLVP